MLTLTNALLGAMLFLLIYIGYTLLRTRNLVIRDMIHWSTIQQDGMESRQYIMNVVHFNSVAHRHTLNVLRQYITAIMNDAVAREDFETAAGCKRMIENMDKLISTDL